jgi:hypothetical protein
MARSLRIALTAVGIAVVAASPALPKAAPDASTAPPPAYQAVLDCQKQADAAQRLACYDKAVGAMSEATTKKDLVIVDRESIRATKRGLFGISLPKVKIFGGNDDVDVDSIESTITSTYSAKDGMSMFVLADGSRWKQTDGRFTFPKAGQKFVVKRAALGSFMANVNGQPAIRVLRILDQ